MEFPDEGQIKALKAKHGDIYVADHEDGTFIFRNLSIGEYGEVSRSNGSSAEIEELIVQAAVVWPEGIDINSYKPGTISTLAEEIEEVGIYRSPLALRGALDEARYHISSDTVETMKAFVLAAMPAYRYSDFDTMGVQELVRLTVVAENIIYVNQMAAGIMVQEPIRFNIKTAEELAAEAAQKISDKGNATVSDPTAQRLMNAMRSGGL